MRQPPAERTHVATCEWLDYDARLEAACDNHVQYVREAPPNTSQLPQTHPFWVREERLAYEVSRVRREGRRVVALCSMTCT